MASLLDEKKLRASFNDSKGSDGKVEMGRFKVILRNIGLDPSDKVIGDALAKQGNNPLDDHALSIFLENVEEALEEGLEKDRNVRKIFNIIDADKNGYLDRYEIKMAFAMLNDPFTEDDVEKLMKEADTDRDGRISFEEFKNSEASAKFAVAII